VVADMIADRFRVARRRFDLDGEAPALRTDLFRRVYDRQPGLF
jgi:hypothetical protein